MDEKIVVALQELKDAVSRQSGGWRQHVSSLAIMLVVAATSAYTGSYLQGRGGNAAIADDLQAIKNQLSETTRTAESIKSEISKRSEINTLRIRKLEELMEQFFVLEGQLSQAVQQVRELPSHPVIGRLSMAKAKMLAGFYFPDVADFIDGWSSAAWVEFQENRRYYHLKDERAAMLRDVMSQPFAANWRDLPESSIWNEYARYLASMSGLAAGKVKHRLMQKMQDLLSGKD